LQKSKANCAYAQIFLNMNLRKIFL